MNDDGIGWMQAIEKYETELLEAFLNQFPRKPTAPAWYDGSQVMVKSAEHADFLADLLESLFHIDYVNTGYYDPEEDKRDNCTDEYTGWHYVSWD